MKPMTLAALLVFIASPAAVLYATESDDVKREVRKQLEEIDSKDVKRNLDGISALNQYVTSRKEKARLNGTGNGVTDEDGVWNQVARHLTQRLSQLESQPDEPMVRRVREIMVRTLASNAHDSTSRTYLLGVLDRGPGNLRTEIIWGMRNKSGLHGTDVYEKLKALCEHGVIQQNQCPTALSNADPDRALNEVLRVLTTTTDKRVFINTARTYEWNYRSPEHFDIIVRRIKEFRLNERFEDYDNGLFWIDRKLLARFLDIAKGQDLANALDVLGMDSGLIDPSKESLMPLIRRLSNPDASIRLKASHRLADISGSAVVDHDLIVASLTDAMQKETDGVTKREIEKDLNSAETARRMKIGKGMKTVP